MKHEVGCINLSATGYSHRQCQCSCHDSPLDEVHTKRCGDADCPCYGAGYEAGKDVAFEACDES
jgi:hypothetical protein